MAIGHTSQNSTKLNDELQAAGGFDQQDAFVTDFFPDGDQWHGDKITHMVPPRATRNGHNGRPRGSPRTHSVRTSHQQLPKKVLFATTATTTTSPTSVTEPPIVGGFESPVPFESVARLPNAERSHQIQSKAAEDKVKGRAPGTQALYGKLQDPSLGCGYIGEFAEWCATDGSKGDVLNGVAVDPDKHPYPVHPTSGIVLEYIKCHFLKRQQWNPKEKKYNKDKPHSKGALENCCKGLKALWDYQAANYRGGLVAYTNEIGPRPNSGSELSSLKTQVYSGIAMKRREKHQPRGAGALIMEGYTRDQNRQLFEFGLTNESLNFKMDGSKMDQFKMRTVHTHHTFAHNGAMRFDDRKKLLLSQICLREATNTGVFDDEKLLCLVLDWRKCNKDGQFETLNFLRHFSDPRRCNWFAFALELFCQIHLQGMDLSVEDFKPYWVEGTNHAIHRWYDRYFFYGNTKSRKGQASRPNAYSMMSYNNVLNSFTHLYACVVLKAFIRCICSVVVL